MRSRRPPVRYVRAKNSTGSVYSGRLTTRRPGQVGGELGGRKWPLATSSVRGEHLPPRPDTGPWRGHCADGGADRVARRTSLLDRRALVIQAQRTDRRRLVGRAGADEQALHGVERAGRVVRGDRRLVRPAVGDVPRSSEAYDWSRRDRSGPKARPRSSVSTFSRNRGSSAKYVFAPPWRATSRASSRWTQSLPSGAVAAMCRSTNGRSPRPNASRALPTLSRLLNATGRLWPNRSGRQARADFP